MAAFVVDLFAYVAVCAGLTATWALTSGSFGDVSRMANDPTLIRTLGFWPVWVYLVWGVVIVIHLGVVLANGLFGRRARTRRQRLVRAARRAAQQMAKSTKSTHPHSVEGAYRDRQRTPTSRPERRWVTVMFTDVVGSTTLAEQVGDDAWSKALAEHRRVVARVLHERGGQLVGTQGDGCLARFVAPVDAVEAGVTLQREMASVRDASDFPLEIRIGIHAGEAVEDDGDLIGRVVNVAARVTAQAGRGEILVTEPVAEHAATNHTLEDRGLCELRGISQARHLLAVNWSEEPAAAG